MNSNPVVPTTAGIGWDRMKSLCAAVFNPAKCFFLSWTSIMPTVSWVGRSFCMGDSWTFDMGTSRNVELKGDCTESQKLFHESYLQLLSDRSKDFSTAQFQSQITC